MVYKPKSQKQLQVGEQIKREVANIFLHGDIFRGDDFKLTVYEADISPDLKNVKIYINIFGEIEKNKLLKELNANSNFFQQKINKSLKLKNVPKVKFAIDESVENAGRISKAIDQENNES
jgi:ribosome-binding factor A